MTASHALSQLSYSPTISYFDYTKMVLRQPRSSLMSIHFAGCEQQYRWHVVYLEEVTGAMKRQIRYFWWAIAAGGIAAATGIGALIRDMIRMRRWRINHEPGPIA